MSHTVDPARNYIYVFLVLIALLVASVLATQLEHSVLNLVVGLAIAVAKASLIVVYFMHIRESNFVTCTMAMAGFLWLAILMTLTMSDYLTRI